MTFPSSVGFYKGWVCFWFQVQFHHLSNPVLPPVCHRLRDNQDGPKYQATRHLHANTKGVGAIFFLASIHFVLKDELGRREL